MYSQELYHHGIEGQRWGKRNGPPYPLNSSARSFAERKASKKAAKKAAKQEKEKTARQRAKELPDDELKAQIARLKLEDEYISYSKKVNPEKVNNGEKFVKDLCESTTKSFSDLLGQVIKEYAARTINKAAGETIVYANNKKK